MIRHMDVKPTGGNPAGPTSSRHVTGSEEVVIKHGDVRADTLFQSVTDRPGMKMIIANHEQLQCFKMTYEIAHAPISFSYALSQRIRCTMRGGTRGKNVIERSPGDGVLGYFPQTQVDVEIMPDKKVIGVSLHFTVNAFNDLFREVPQCLKNLGSRCDGLPMGHRYYQQSRFNLETLVVLRQILQCPYEGEIRRLFFEAKSLELVALKLAELGQNTPRGISDLKRTELDRIREAYHLLLTRLDAPPSLIDLSRFVGINRNKLNWGFKGLYGDTAFNVLRNARLLKAKSMIEQTDLTLSEIALSVGYNNQANFTTAFRNQFGKTPNTVRRDVGTV